MRTTIGPGLPVRPTFRGALRVRPFRLLLLGEGLGTVAQGVITLAVGVAVLEQTASSVWVSITVALGYLPYVLFSPLAGVVADRFSRSAVLAWSAGIRAGLTAVLAAGLAMQWAASVVVMISAIAAVLGTASYPALVAGTAECAPDDHLPAANALVTTVENVAWIAGPGILGLILLAGDGPLPAAVVSAALFAGAAAASARVGLVKPARPEALTGSGSAVRAAVRLVLRDDGARRSMSAATLDNFLYGYLVVALVLVAVERSPDPAAVGLLSAALAGGAVLAILGVNRLAALGDHAVVLGVTLLVFAGVVVALGFPLGLTAAALLAIIAGGATLVAEVMAVTQLQAATPPAITATVFGVYDQVNVGAIALGSLLAGPLAGWLGTGPAVVAVGAAGVLAAGALTWSGRRVRAPAAVAPIRDTAVAHALP